MEKNNKKAIYRDDLIKSIWEKVKKSNPHEEFSQKNYRSLYSYRKHIRKSLNWFQRIGVNKKLIKVLGRSFEDLASFLKDKEEVHEILIYRMDYGTKKDDEVINKEKEENAKEYLKFKLKVDDAIYEYFGSLFGLVNIKIEDFQNAAERDQYITKNGYDKLDIQKLDIE